MQRVVVLGRGAAGKSTAAARLGVRVGLPVLLPDALRMARRTSISGACRLLAMEGAVAPTEQARRHGCHRRARRPADVHVFRVPRQLARFIAGLESYEPPPG
ncbi:MAG: hypothetical protein M3R66_17170 [Actinomycetota bacterium]|nr:hypothetical protein [Actinomycetota bacterium]